MLQWRVERAGQRLTPRPLGLAPAPPPLGAAACRGIVVLAINQVCVRRLDDQLGVVAAALAAAPLASES